MEFSKDDDWEDGEENAYKERNPSAVMGKLITVSLWKFSVFIIAVGSKDDKNKYLEEKRYTLPFTFSIHSHQSM